MNFKNESIEFDLGNYIEKYIHDEKIKNNIRSAKVILLPYERFREEKGPLFPEGYAEFYEYSKERLGEEIEICVEDSEYKEIALHNNTVELGILFITGILLPVISNLITDFIKSKFEKKKANIKIEVIEKEGKSSRKYLYEGPAEDFERVFTMMKEKEKKNGN